MSPAHVVQPTYEAIKRRLMTGEWPAGARLESARIADLLGVSVTPVRDSLYRLAGERMVDFAHGEGFHVHRLTETEYRDMLEYSLVLLLAALAAARAEPLALTASSAGYAERIADLFLRIAARAANGELSTGVAAINDRLHLTRCHDQTIVGGVTAELAALEAANTQGAEHDVLRKLVTDYHERRAGEAAAYARLLAAKTV